MLATSRVNYQQAFFQLFGLALIFLVTLRPHPRAVPALIETYMADVVLGFCMLLYLLIPKPRLLLPRALATTALVGVATLTIIVLSSSLSFLFSISEGEQIGAAALINSIRYIYYGLALFYVCAMFTRLQIKIATLLKWINLAFVVNFSIALIQALDPPFMGELIKNIWSDDKLRSIWTGYPRVYGAFLNANWFSVFLIFVVSFWTSLFIERRIRWSVYAIQLTALAFLLLLSGSRSGMIGVVVALMVCFMGRNFWRRGRNILSIVTLGIVFLIIFHQLNQVPQVQLTLLRFTKAVTSLSEGKADEIKSFEGRMTYWDTSLAYFVKRPIIGYGTNQIRANFIPHNSFLTVLLTFGLLGFTAIFCFTAFISYRIALRRSYSGEQKIVGRWYVSFTMAFLVVMMSADFINTSQVILLWIIIVGFHFSLEPSAFIATESGYARGHTPRPHAQLTP